jgi:uncharacterized membrane protein SpoIIM required for sporulation
LAELVERAGHGRGLKGLTEEELLEFGRLYRRTAAELSHARAHGLEAADLEYLNWLVGRAYGLLYVSESMGWRSVPRFFAAELPQTLRRHGRLLAIAGALMAGPALIGALLTLLRPDLLEVVSPGLASLLQPMAERHEGGADWLPAEMRPFMSSFIMVNNIKVSFLAFALGILLGLGTVLVLISNGFMLGVIGAGISRSPSAIYFWSFVAPHGVVELPAIVISAAAGLLLGLAVIEPGNYSRLDALKVAGRQAAVLMFGVIVFLVFAGLVEGFFSPAVLPPTAKFLGAAVIATAFWSYILLAGRKAEVKAPTAP